MLVHKFKSFCFISALCGAVGVAVPSQAATLESPAHGAILSGIGFISGWKCDAKNITITIDKGGPIPMAMDMPRDDTRLICGTSNNGYIIQVNWNFLKDGEHIATAYNDGKEFARNTFTVVTTGTEFFRVGNQPLTTQCEVRDFPSVGETSLLVWEESTQHFELAEIKTSSTEQSTVTDPSLLAQTCPEWTTTGVGGISANHMQECLDAGADNTETVNGFSILRHLVSSNNEEAARVLLKAGADPNAFSPEFEPVLHHALSQGKRALKMVGLLLTYGADPNLTTTYMYNPPFRVLFSHWLGHWEEDVLLAMELLLAAGARVSLDNSIPTSHQETPLHYAMLATINLTREGGQLPPETLTHVREVVLRLLEAGADINAQQHIPHRESDQGYRLGLTALHYAAQDRAAFRGGTEIVELLLEQGADPDIANHSIQVIREEGSYATTYRRVAVPDRTVLYHVMRLAYWHSTPPPLLPLVQLLLDTGADPNVDNADGKNSLHYLKQLKMKPSEEEENPDLIAEYIEIERALVQAGAVPSESYECFTDECTVAQLQ